CQWPKAANVSHMRTANWWTSCRGKAEKKATRAKTTETCAGRNADGKRRRDRQRSPFQGKQRAGERMKVIDADAHVIENESTWDYMLESERQFKPKVVVPTSAKDPFDYWLVD